MPFLISIKYYGSFPDGDKVIEISSPNGAGGNSYHLMVDKFYWGIISKNLHGWRVALQVPNDEYSSGDLQPLIDLVVGGGFG